MAALTVKERRTSLRIDVRLPVTLRYCGRLIPATALNISCGGMLLATTPGDVTTNAPVEVILDLSDAERDLTVRGEVIRISSPDTPQIGVQFTNFYALGYQTIERFVRGRARQ